MLTQPEREYVKRLLQAQPSLTNQDLDVLIEKRRQKEATMNIPKEKGVLGKTFDELMNIGGGAIQAGGELAVGLPGQLSRLLPGDQSADKNSFYNKTQRLLESTKQDQAAQGRNTEGLGFGFGKGVINIAAGSVGANLVGQGLSAAAKTKMLTNLGLKVAELSPTVAKYGTAAVEGLTGASTKGNIVQKVIGGAVTGAREGLGFGLASGNDPRSAMKTGAIIGGTFPILAEGVKLVGKGIKSAGESLYKTAIKPTADEARNIIQYEGKLAGATKKAAKNMKAPILRSDTALKYGISGTQKGIAVKGVTQSEKIFKKTINPALARSKITHNIDDLLANVEKQIANEKSALRKQDLIDGLEALKDEFSATGKKIFRSGDLQAEKSFLDKFTPSKIFKGKEVAQGYTQVKSMLANVLREQVRTDLAKAGVKNAKQLYRDWANLTALEDIGVKGITEGGLKGGFGTFWSTLYDAIATPIKTIGGKTLYKTGNGIQFLGPTGIKNLGDFLRKGGYKLVGDILTKI